MFYDFLFWAYLKIYLNDTKLELLKQGIVQEGQVGLIWWVILMDSEFFERLRWVRMGRKVGCSVSNACHSC